MNISLTLEERNMVWQALYSVRATGRFGPDNRRYGHPNEKLDVVDKLMNKMKVS